VSAKVELVRQVHSEFGLALALAVLGLPRSTWYYQRQRTAYAERHAALRRPLEAIARAHPEYGYRRVTTELEARLGRTVNHKVVQRLHQHWELPLLRHMSRDIISSEVRGRHLLRTCVPPTRWNGRPRVGREPATA